MFKEREQLNDWTRSHAQCKWEWCLTKLENHEKKKRQFEAYTHPFSLATSQQNDRNTSLFYNLRALEIVKRANVSAKNEQGQKQ